MRAIANGFLSLILLFLPHVLMGQQPNTSPNRISAEPRLSGQSTRNITGTVLNGTTGEPLQHAHVGLLSGTNAYAYSVETNAAGYFAIAGIPPGNYEVTVSRTGFLAYRNVERNSQAAPLLIRLIPQSVILGLVADQDGEPMADAKVQVTRAGTNGASLDRTTAVTNDLGEYRLYGLPPGEYFVSAMPPLAISTMSRRVTDSAALDNYVRTFYPRATDTGTAQKIVLRPGDQASDIDIQLIKSAPQVVKVVDLTGAFAPVSEQPTPTAASTGFPAGTAASAELPRTSSISGQVMNAVSNEPVRHAQVMLLNLASGDAIPYTTETDATGAFRLAHIEAGDYRLSVLRHGFLPADGYSGGTGKIVSIKPRAETSNVVVPISPASVITGRVFAPDGGPACDMRVYAIQLGYSRGQRQLRVTATAKTDDTGQYRLYGLPQGNYYVQASAQQSAETNLHAAHNGSRRQYVSSFYPHAGDVFSAAKIGVPAGNQVAGIDIWTETRQRVTIRGRVVNSGASRISRETVVSLTPQDTQAGISQGSQIADIKDSEGHFEIRDVVPGAYSLSATVAAGKTQHAGSIPLEVRTVDLNNVQVPMHPAVNTSAVVQVTGPERMDPRRVRVFLEPENHLPTATVVGRVRRDGTFLLPNALPGRYTLKLFGIPETLYISDLQVGDRSTDASIIDFSRGVMPLRITLSAAGGRVTGSVFGPQQQSVSGAKVVLIPDVEHRSSYDLYKVVTTAKDGSFRIVGIAPGEYSLFAWPRVEADGYYDPDFLATFEELGTRVVIRENSSATVNLELLSRE